ncbi:SHOCT domain-containing protein [Natronorarus salvus]|uniref:SHOCT domain-containing protein n=1 Tax=Natronorarus salvus TaxID=3117733 RepID=UPI002F25FF78
MSGVRNWVSENPLFSLVALVLGSGIAITGIVFGFVLLVVLVGEAPFLIPILAGLLLVVSLLAIYAARRGYLSIGSDASDAEESEEALDPVDELERRYVRGEIGEEEFEHRLSVLLDADDRAGRERDWDRERSGERELEFER